MHGVVLQLPPCGPEVGPTTKQTVQAFFLQVRCTQLNQSPVHPPISTGKSVETNVPWLGWQCVSRQRTTDDKVLLPGALGGMQREAVRQHECRYTLDGAFVTLKPFGSDPCGVPFASLDTRSQVRILIQLDNLDCFLISTESNRTLAFHHHDVRWKKLTSIMFKHVEDAMTTLQI